MAGKKIHSNRQIINKIGDCLKRNLNVILLSLGMTILSTVLIIFKMEELGGFNHKRVIFVFGFLVILTLIILGILYYARVKRWKIEKIFLVCGLLLGTLYCIFLPIGAAPDEPAHFWRAYEITEGQIIGTKNGADVPSNLDDIVRVYNSNGYLEQGQNFGVVAETEYEKIYGPADSYSIFNYLPQTIGVLIGKIFCIPLIPSVFIARFLNMITSVLIIYLCIKYIPALKKMVFLIGLFPMTMQLFASVSADASIICAGIALITYVLYVCKTMKRRIGYADFLILLLICLTLILTKPVYAFMCLVVCWIPASKFKSRKHKILFIILLGGFTCAAYFFKMLVSPMPLAERYGTVDLQISFMLQQPLRFFDAILRSMLLNPVFYIDGVVGRSLEWLSLDIYAPYIITIFILFILLCAEKGMKIPKSLKIFAMISFMLVVALIFTSMYITWTEVGLSSVEGVQGRYFLPVLLFIPLFFMPSGQSKRSELIRPTYLYVIMLLANAYALAVICCSHIG